MPDHKISKPFHVRLAICFTGKDGKHPQPKTDIGKLFQIIRGYKAYGSPTSNGQTLVDRRLVPRSRPASTSTPRTRATSRVVRRRACAVDGQCPDGEAPVGGRLQMPDEAARGGGRSRKLGKNENSWYYDKTTAATCTCISSRRSTTATGRAVAVTDRQLRSGQGAPCRPSARTPTQNRPRTTTSARRADASPMA